MKQILKDRDFYHREMFNLWFLAVWMGVSNQILKCQLIRIDSDLYISNIDFLESYRQTRSRYIIRSGHQFGRFEY